MNHIDYFKLQAENLHKDYKTKKWNSEEGFYDYSPKFFDIDQIFLDFNWDDHSFTLMNAQHLIARILGFSKWKELKKASEEQLDFLHLLFDNQDKATLDEWKMYLSQVEIEDIETDFALQKETFQQVFINEKIRSDFLPYRLDCQQKHYDMDPKGNWFVSSRF